MRELKVKNDNIVRIANFFNIRVIGKFATYISDTFGYEEEEVIQEAVKYTIFEETGEGKDNE